MLDPFKDLPEGTKAAGDLLSLATLVGTLVMWLPSVASLLTIVWSLIRIYESATVQKLLGKGDNP